MILTKRQTEAFDYLEDNETTDVLYGGGAGGGKSYFGNFWVIYSCLKYAGSRYLIGRTVLKTLKETTLVSFFDVCKDLKLKDGIDYRYNQQASNILFSNGSEILLKDLYDKPSDVNLDSFGSLEITGAFIDECSQVTKRVKDVISSRIRYKLDQFGLIPKMLMTCNPSKNWVFSDFYKLDKENKLPNYRKFVVALVTDNPHISKHYISQLEKLDETQKQRLLHGNFEYDDDPNALTDYESILDAFDNSHVVGIEKYITADIATRGSDEATIGFWKGWILEEYKVLPIANAKGIEDTVREMKIKNAVVNSNICYDSDGIGDYLGSYIKGAKGFINAASPLEEKTTTGKKEKPNYRYLKTQCEFKLAEKINNGEIWLKAVKSENEKEMFIEELSQLKQKNADNDGKLETISKEDIKKSIGRSPDRMDMLKMRVYFDLIPRITTDYSVTTI